jgi:hypothetical protein
VLAHDGRRSVRTERNYTHEPIAPKRCRAAVGDTCNRTIYGKLLKRPCHGMLSDATISVPPSDASARRDAHRKANGLAAGTLVVK